MQPLHTKKYINAYISLGSNMGNRRENVTTAAAHLHKKVGKIVRSSSLYETQPWGEVEQDPFINQVIMLNTTLDPRQILEELTKIEREMGRVRKEKWGPRPIDIDILFYGKRVIRDKGLEIPHPELHKRAFVLVPMMEIDPEFEHPVLNMAMDQLFMDCEDPADVVMLEK